MASYILLTIAFFGNLTLSKVKCTLELVQNLYAYKRKIHQMTTLARDKLSAKHFR